MRRRLTFLASTAIVSGIWWIYHAVLIFAGWYGFMGGIPAFTVGLLGFRLVRRRAHRAVAVDLAERVGPRFLERAGPVLLLLIGRRRGPGFHGSRYLLGEFGWLGAVGMFILGVVCGGGSVPQPGRPVPEGADRLRVTGDVAMVPHHPQAQGTRRGNVTSSLSGLTSVDGPSTCQMSRLSLAAPRH